VKIRPWTVQKPEWQSNNLNHVVAGRLKRVSRAVAVNPDTRVCSRFPEILQEGLALIVQRMI
jgi:hypothetical protein